MARQILFLTFILAICPWTLHAATCSRMNLTKCLDSVCAINSGSNPAARCQYCGTASAGTPPSTKGMRTVSVGKSSSTTISDKELKNAPTDPGARYTWATQQCLDKIAGCTPDDVTEVYDKLIEQSCTAAGVTAQMASAASKLQQSKTEATCRSEIQVCLVSDSKCAPDYSLCQNDADFDRSFSACAVQAAGCDAFVANLRTAMMDSRNEELAATADILNGVINAYRTARQMKWEQTKANCVNNLGRDRCIEHVCATNMPNKCAEGYQAEKASATLWCKYYETACNQLKSKEQQVEEALEFFNGLNN